MVEQRARSAASGSRLGPVDLRYRRYDPAQRVAARIEIAGPSRLLPAIRAGVDVHGDGSADAYTGRATRVAVEAEVGEPAWDALRRRLGDGS